MQERVLWKQRVEIALAEKRFVLFVQPIVNIKDGVTSHWEVLLRMRGEAGELIAPSYFIEVAESTGLIHSLDRMVLSEAAAHLALMRDRGREITLTVNLSAHAFNDPDLLIHLKRVIQDNRLNPRQIIFEMTETAAVSDIGPARRLMEAINEIGCLFALDDFGTGFSSFDYLRQLPFEYIKIDGSFIRNLSRRPDDQVLVKAMVEIAMAFKKKTIAEQVEDAETFALLKEYGVDYSQGYYTGRPTDITEAFRLL
jgi:EAL domain-containing protein (putative c-di-GMP-specific phosphodiesterase class I)